MAYSANSLLGQALDKEAGLIRLTARSAIHWGSGCRRNGQSARPLDVEPALDLGLIHFPLFGATKSRMPGRCVDVPMNSMLPASKAACM